MEDQSHHDVADLARFGYKQELRRALGVYSSFAVAFSYISPSTGIFTLYALGLGIGGPAFIWSWPLVAVGQFIIALNFAEVSSHFPVAGSVYQWTKYLSNRHYSWFTGWIYLFAGILTVTAVDVTIPIVLIPLLNNLCVQVENNAQNQVIIGAIFLYSTIIAIPGNMNDYVTAVGGGKAAPPVDIIEQLPGWAANLYLFVVFAAIYVCCLAIQTSTIRLAFGMARDGKLPLGRIYNKVHPTLHTPVGTCLVIGGLAAIPLLYYAGAGTIAIAATGMIYLSYILGNIAILIARLNGWPKESAPFKLGSWGMIVNVLGLVWGGSMLINFLWPRSTSNPPLTALPNSSVPGFLGNIPVFEGTVGVIVVIGAIYYAFAQNRMPDTTKIAPAEATA